MAHNDPTRQPFATPQLPAGRIITSQQQSGEALERGPQSSASTTTVLPRQGVHGWQQVQVQAGPSVSRVNTAPQQAFNLDPPVQYLTSGLTSSQYHFGHQQEAMARPPRQQQFSQIDTNVMYSDMQQITTQRPLQSPFEHVQHYRSQSSDAIETLPSQYREPSAAQYYVGDQPRPYQATPAAYGPSQGPTHFEQHTYVEAGPSASSSFSGAMFNSSQQSPYQSLGQPPQQQALFGSRDQYHFQGQFQADSTQRGWNDYYDTLRSIFTNVRDRSLHHIPSQLRQISDFLLRGAEVLGLTQDEDGQHDVRLAMWDNFNRAWLTTLQCQYEMMKGIAAGQAVLSSQSVLDRDTLESLGRMLVEYCDSMEKFGLVDYQMGVAEEEIMDIMVRCLRQLEIMQGQNDEAMETSSSSHGQQQ